MAEKPSERTVRQVPRFKKSKRRLPESVQTEVDNEVKILLGNPMKGEPKQGPLKDVRVVKFKAQDQQYLLAYYFHARQNVIEVLDVGVHENFYKDLGNYLTDR